MSSGGLPDIEERKLRIEEGKLENERSFARRWFPTIVTLAIAIATLGFNVAQWAVAHEERRQATDVAAAAAEAERLRQNGAWGGNVLELYVKYPDQFDPAKVSAEAASSNLSALVVVAPALMQPILQAKIDAIVRSRQSSETAAADPVVEKQIDTVLNTITVAAAQADQLTAKPSPALLTNLPNLPSGISAGSYTVYIQYPEGSKDVAAKLAAVLRGYGFRVPAQEKVANVPAVPQVRYYQETQDKLARALAAAVGNSASPTFIGAGRDLPDGILEIWLPKAT